MGDQSIERAARPWCKYAGGKAKLASKIISFMPKRFRAYHEPFVGGGAVFWALAAEPSRRFEWAYLADTNAELVNAYNAIEDHVDVLISLLGWHEKQHSSDRRVYYDKLRSRTLEIPEDYHDWPDVVMAARTIALNKTSFNGLMRFNKKGEFNVPYGKYKNPTICDAENLMRCHRVLEGNATTRVADFEESIADAGAGDVIYADSPYIPLSKTSSFVAYGKDGFGALEQMRLARVLRKAQARGAMTILSNSDTPLTREIFAGCGKIIEVAASRSINSKGDKRGAVGELLIVDKEIT